MRKPLLAAAFLSVILPVPFAAPALAQQADRVLVIFGNDKCPTNASGEQIVVCSRRPEGERYRIPKEMRTPIIITPENQSWAAKANDTLDAGAGSGVGSCTTSGPGGNIGCWAQQMRAAKRQRQAQNAESEVVEQRTRVGGN